MKISYQSTRAAPASKIEYQMCLICRRWYAVTHAGNERCSCVGAVRNPPGPHFFGGEPVHVSDVLRRIIESITLPQS